MKRIVSILLVLCMLLAAVSLVACDDKDDGKGSSESGGQQGGQPDQSNNDSNDDESEEKSEESSEEDEEDDDMPNETVPCPTDVVTDAEYDRAIALNDENTNLSLLQYAMNKAASGERVTVATIGGSVTEGTGASDKDKTSYSALFRDWWKATFPETLVNHQNAGIGGTTSYFGIHRLDNLLLTNPDVCIVEFSVNDREDQHFKDAYESIIAKLLDHGVAVICLFMVAESGWNTQNVHMPIAKKYNVPMISYSDAIFPTFSNGTRVWSDISDDNIHPNDKGYEYTGELLWKYLNSVWETCPSDVDPFSGFTSSTLRSTPYYNATMYDYTDLESKVNNVKYGSFDRGTSVIKKQSNGWFSPTGSGGLEFTMEFRNLGFLYADGSAKLKVYVDGDLVGTVEPPLMGETAPIYESSTSASHKVRIEVVETSKSADIGRLLITK